MAVDSAEFRRIMGHWTSGVAIVSTTAADGGPRGLTANAVASVSLEPPLVLVCIERGADTHDAIRAAGAFAISILPQTAERTARRFAGDEPESKFDGVAYRTETTGAPVLEEAVAWVDCRVHDILEGGDHSIYVGQVLAGDAHGGEPLVYFRGGFNRLGP